MRITFNQPKLELGKKKRFLRVIGGGDKIKYRKDEEKRR